MDLSRLLWADRMEASAEDTDSFAESTSAWVLMPALNFVTVES